MKKRKKEGRKINQFIRRNPVWIAAVLISCCLLGGLLAKYIHQTVTDPGQITSEYFYFTADILGDTKMVAEDGSSEEIYSFNEKSTEGTWYLYGGSEHSIDIKVQNYYDELRITKEKISFTAELNVEDADGKTIETKSAGPTITRKDSADSSSGTYELTGDQEASEILNLTIPSNSSWAYPENMVLTVKITSTAPYEKTLTLHFVLYAKEAALRYEVKDSVGSPYAELVIMTNVETESGTEQNVKPYIRWPETLSIDNTNKLTFKYDNGTFTQQDGMTERNMQISEAFATGRSESIYFFKSNPSENYTKSETIVQPQNGQYTIDLTTE